MESIRLHKKNTGPRKRKQETIAWFEKVKLPDPAGMFHRLPPSIKWWPKAKGNDRNRHVLPSLYS